MIDTTDLAKEYGARVLFEDVTLRLNAGNRYGLVGANGSGKTTFLRLLAGDEEASHGSFTFQKRARLGVLRQDRFLDDEAVILELAMRGTRWCGGHWRSSGGWRKRRRRTRCGSRSWRTSSPRTTGTR